MHFYSLVLLCVAKGRQEYIRGLLSWECQITCCCETWKNIVFFWPSAQRSVWTSFPTVFRHSTVLLPLAISLQHQFPAIWQQSLFLILGYRIFHRKKAISPDYLQGATGRAAKKWGTGWRSAQGWGESIWGSVIMEAVTSGQLRVWAGKVKWIRWERKKLGIKDFGPGHSSCPLTDF